MIGLGSTSTDTRNNKESIYYVFFFHKSEDKFWNEKNKTTGDFILISKIIIKHIENVAICSLVSSKSKIVHIQEKPKKQKESYLYCYT